MFSIKMMKEVAEGSITAMESSVEMAMADSGVLSRILTRLSETQDLLSASMVCKQWNDVLTWASHKLTVRSTTLLPSLLSRFKYVRHLNFTPCCDQLQDSHLQLTSEYLKNLRILSLGNTDQPQECISNLGFVGFVTNCTMLEEIALCDIPNLLDSGIEAIARICKMLKSLSLGYCMNLSDIALDSLKNCKNIQELSLNGPFRFTQSGLSRIGENCPTLRKVSFVFDDSIDITLVLRSLATHCLHLQELSLNFGHGDLRELSRLSNLLTLRITVNSMQEACPPDSLASIAAANRGLKEFLYFNSAFPLNDSALTRILQNCRSLEKLCLLAQGLTQVSLLCIMKCKDLKSLELHYFPSDGQGLAMFDLRGMRLTDFLLRGVTDLKLETLMHSNNQLERINLNGCSVQNSKGFSAVGNSSNLQILDLSCTTVDDLSLITIASGAKMLRHLNLAWCRNISSLKVLSNFKALEYLDVTNCNFVTDEGLHFLAASCSKLSHLCLISTRITDDGLSHLASCSLLRSLEIYYCNGVQGPGLVTIALSCNWLQYLAISDRFEGTSVLEELRKQCCLVRLEDDDVPIYEFWS